MTSAHKHCCEGRHLWLPVKMLTLQSKKRATSKPRPSLTWDSLVKFGYGTAPVRSATPKQLCHGPVLRSNLRAISRDGMKTRRNPRTANRICSQNHEDVGTTQGVRIRLGRAAAGTWHRKACKDVSCQRHSEPMFSICLSLQAGASLELFLSHG